MKKTKSLPILLTAIVITLFGCRDKHTVTRLMNVPVYSSMEEIRSQQLVVSERQISHPGKIFFKDSKIFITELGEGVHVVNNEDPSNPQREAFIQVPGAMDVQMKNEFLYVDSYTDLVVFDLSNTESIQFSSRVEDVFIYNLPEHNGSYPRAEVDPEKGVVVDWTVEQVTEELDEFDSFNVWGEGVSAFQPEQDMDASFVSTSFEGANKTTVSTFGKAGSMSRFMIKGDNLYVLDAWKLITLDISQEDSPEKVNELNTPYFSETIFPMRGHLVLGTQQGILFYDLENNGIPNYVSEYQHVTSCDPVVVSNDHAYVTLRSGNTCNGWVNELHIVNVEDISAPHMVNQFMMNSPRGLSVDNGKLFLCDGSDGLKVFDLIQQTDIQLSQQYSNFQANDVITFNNILMMIGHDGLVQYDISDINNIIQISVIETVD